MTTNLAPVYLDDARVQLQGDPCPPVAKILQAGGKAGRAGRVLRLRSLDDREGSPLGLEDVIDRATTRGPVYLRCVTDSSGARPSLGKDESTGLGEAAGTVTRQEFGGTGQAPRHDPSSSIGNRVRGAGAGGGQEPGQESFGAARPGMAGGGAKGSAGRLPADKQAKSDFGLGERDGQSNTSYGVGDLAPGGRTGLSDAADRRAHGAQPDSTQAFQSGGRSGEGLQASYGEDVGNRGAPPLATGDEGVGSTARRQAGGEPASGAKGRAQGAQGRAPVDPEAPRGDLRDSSTDHDGRQQRQSGT